MTRTTVTIDDEKMDLLRSLAAERGVSVSCLVRGAVDQKLAWYRPPGQRPKPKALGMGYSNGGPSARELTEADPAIPPFR